MYRKQTGPRCESCKHFGHGLIAYNGKIAQVCFKKPKENKGYPGHDCMRQQRYYAASWNAHVCDMYEQKEPNKMKLSSEEIYIVHNLMMERAHKTLIELGQPEVAQIMQSIANDATGSLILHNLIHTVMEMMELDRITEPNTEI